MYWIDTTQEYTGTPAIRNFFCDATSDVNDLPTSSALGVQQGEDTISCQKVNPGSFCLCIGTGSGYILNSNDQWVAV